MRTGAVLILVALCAVVLFGCASRQVQELNKKILSYEKVERRDPNSTYVLDPPDSFRVESDVHAELTRDVVIRQDGMVTLPLLGDIQVQGLTPLQVKETLEKSYSEYYKDIDLLVTVTGFNSKRVFIYGEVGGRGSRPYTGEQTIMDLIGEVGGFIPTRAAPTRVWIIRGGMRVDEDGDLVDETERYKVNLNKLLFEGDMSQNVYLAENDVVYVPPNVFAWLGNQVEMILLPFRSVLGAIAVGVGISTAVD